MAELGYTAGWVKCARCEEAEGRIKALAEALRGLVEAVEREYGEQPDVPALVAAKALLK